MKESAIYLANFVIKIDFTEFLWLACIFLLCSKSKLWISSLFGSDIFESIFTEPSDQFLFLKIKIVFTDNFQCIETTRYTQTILLSDIYSESEKRRKLLLLNSCLQVRSLALNIPTRSVDRSSHISFINVHFNIKHQKKVCS